MTASSRTGTARKRTGSKQKNTQISTRKKHASAMHNGKDAKLIREPRTPRQAGKQNKREGAALSGRANGKDRNHDDEQAANQQVTVNEASDSVCKRKDRAWAVQHPIDEENGRPASSDSKRPDDAIQANRAGLQFSRDSMLPIQAIAIAHWQFWATAMAVYPRAWISASSASLGRR